MPDSIAFRAKHSDIGTDDYRAKDFYKNAYRLIDDSYTAIAWRSEDRSLVYLAVANRGNELSVLHFPASALEELDSPALSHEDLFNVLGARPGPPRGQRLCGERRRGRIRPHVAGGGIVQAFRAGLGSGWRTRS